jgi:hypothetical protein
MVTHYKIKYYPDFFLSKSMPNFNFVELIFYERKEKSDETYSFCCSAYLYFGAELL